MNGQELELLARIFAMLRTVNSRLAAIEGHLGDIEVAVYSLDLRTEQIAEKLGIFPPEDGGDEA